MNGKFPLSHHLTVSVQVDRDVGGTLTFEQAPGKELSLNCYEWEDLVRVHADINRDVHERWRNAANVREEEGENAVLRWTGLPVKPGQTVDDLDPAMLFFFKLINGLPMNATGNDILTKLHAQIDEILAADRIGSTKRLATRFHNDDTQVHFYEYHPRTAAVINLLNIDYVEWLEFHKHFVEIDGLMQKRAKSRRRPPVVETPVSADRTEIPTA